MYNLVEEDNKMNKIEDDLGRVTIKFILNKQIMRGSYSLDEKVSLLHKRYLINGLIQLTTDFTEKILSGFGEIVKNMDSELKKYNGE
jgi:archaellum component FlaC